MEIYSRRYLGNKTKLLPFITEIIKQECGDFTSVFDAFAGTGAVASAFLDKKIITNDILYSNYISHIAWFQNAKFDKKKVERIIAEYNNLSDNIPENYMSQNFSDTYFSKTVCKKIGHIREDIETKYNAGEINEKERAVLITSLLYAMDRIANTCGHYDAWRRGVDFTDEIVLQPLDVFPKTSKRNQFFNMDTNELAKTVKSDVVYLDPPYNSRQYCDAYHLLENVARWEKPAVEGVARKMNRDNLKSEYCKKTAAEAFEDLVQKLDCKYIVLSYNNTGDNANGRSNAKITDDDIMRILQTKGTVKVFSQSHKAFSAGKSDLSGNEERLFVCKVFEKKPKGDLISSPLNYTGGKTKLLPQILPLFPQNISTFCDLFCGGCNVGLNISANTHIYNDIDASIIGFYTFLQSVDKKKFVAAIDKTIAKYKLSNSSKNGYEEYGCESSAGLGEYNKTGYLALRNDFNNCKSRGLTYYSLFYTLIVFSFNNQIRFNSKGEFNLPVGKRDFNDKMRQKLGEFIDTIKSQNAVFYNLSFDQVNIPQDSFVYIDPPYLISTATYNENGGWNEDCEKKLLEFMTKLNQRGIKFALSNVLEHKGRKNTLLIDWCEANKDVIKIAHLNYDYSNSSYQSKNKTTKTDEVLIFNY